ncbi:extracellular solute-binding protein [Microbacterium rhizomatis]|nr:extracellular solute-binding protein [Microbacterium rhizomatis]
MTQSPRHRRKTAARSLGTLLAVGAAVVLAGCAGSPPSTESSETALSGDVVWADYGGRSNETNAQVFHDPFFEDTGVEVTSTTRADSVAFEMLGGGEGDYDVIMSGTEEAYRFQDGLATLPQRDLVDEVVPEDLRDYMFGSFIFASAQGYLAETFPDGGPQSWADFYDFDTFPGLRAVPGTAANFDFMFEYALLADGVAPEDLWPIDIPRALAKMDELKGHVIFYTEYPQVQQLLVSKSAAIAVTTHSAYKAITDAGFPTETVWNQALASSIGYVIPKTAPNLDNALALASFYADPERQAEFAMITGNGPATQAAFDFIPEDQQNIFPNSPQNLPLVIEVDSAAREAQYDALSAAYGEWLLAAQP